MKAARVLDVLWDKLSLAKSGALWLLVRLLGRGGSFKEFIDRRYEDAVETPVPDFKAAKEVDHLESLCRTLYAESERRLAQANDKCKALLTVSAILLALAAALITQWKVPLPIAWTPVCLILLSILVLLEYLGIGRFEQPDLSEEDPILSEAERKRQWAQSYYRCARQLDLRVDFLLDLVIAARRCLLLGLASLAVFFCWGVPAAGRNKNEVVSAVCERLRDGDLEIRVRSK